MGTKAGTYPIDDFSGGQITKASIIKLEPNQSPNCMNVFGNLLGTLKKRLGYEKLNSVSTAGVCNGLFGYIVDSSTKYLMAMWGAGIYKMDAGASGWDGTWDSVTLDTKSSLTSDDASFTVFKKGGEGILIMGTASQDLPHSWDGSGSTEVIAGGAKGKYYYVWNNHVWAGNCETFTIIDNCDEVWDVDTELVEDCEQAWDEIDPVANVVSSTDATDHMVGEACVKIVIGASFTTGIAATEAIAQLDISDYDYLTYWIKSSVNTSAGDLEILLDETAECASPGETLEVPALTANTWTMVNIAFAEATTYRDGLISVGLNVATDLGAQTVWLDDIRAVTRANIVHSTNRTSKMQGVASMYCGVTAAHTTGLVCAKATNTTLDLEEDNELAVWVSSSYDSSGDADSGLQILLDDTPDCDSETTREALTIPKMSASTWTYHEISLANPADDTAIKSVGLKITTDNGAQDIYIDAVRTTRSEPDQLRRSAIGEYDDWSGTDSGWDNIFTPNEVGITGLTELDGRFYIFKRRSIHRITYLGGRPLIDIKMSKGNVGSISPRTILNVDVPKKGARLIFLGSDRQMYVYDGYNAEPVSDVIQSDNGHSDVFMENINTTSGVETALGLCHAINIPDRNWYVLFCPISSSATACTHAIVYDYLAEAAYPFDAQAFSCSYYGDNGIGTTQAYTAKTNYAYDWLSGNDDDGTDIDAYWESGKISAGKKGRPMLKKARYAELSYAANASATFTFSYRNDWDTSWVDTTSITTTTEGTTVRDISQIHNIIQFKISDDSDNPQWEIYAIDVPGGEATVGRTQ